LIKISDLNRDLNQMIFLPKKFKTKKMNSREYGSWNKSIIGWINACRASAVVHA